MGKRELEIVLISAESLTKYHLSDKMVVKAGAYIGKDNSVLVEEQYTEPDKDGDANPTWNHRLQFTLRYSWRRTPGVLFINLYDTVSGRKSSCFDTVQIPLKSFIDFSGKEATTPLLQQYQGSSGGILHISYRLGPYISRAAALHGVGTFIGSVVGNVVGDVVGDAIGDLFNKEE